jgi:hypothetical protein
MRAERLDHPQHFTRAWVDPTSGLVLRWEQRTLDGTLLAEVEFETIDFRPDLTGREMHVEPYEESALDLGRDLSEQVGFPVLEPQLLPAGYRLDSAESFADAEGSIWLRRIYHDGCDVLALVQSAPVSGTGPAAARMDQLELGAWVLFAGEIARSQVIALGRVGEDELRLFLQSSSFGK